MSKESASDHEAEPLAKTVWLFPGQGTQFVGMGKDLYEKYPAIREKYQLADKILGFPISTISFEGPAEVLNETRFTQPATFLYSYANMTAARIEGNNDFVYDPIFIAGHSFGEYNALVAAGALSFEDGLKLVMARAEATQRASEINPGGMLATKTNRENPLLKEALTIFDLDTCVINSDEQVVIGGPKEKLKEAELWLKEKGVKSIPLNVSGPFHTRLMGPAVEIFKQALDIVDLKDAKIPIIGNTTARPIKTKEEIRQELIDQLTHPVRWQETTQFLKEQGITKTLEVGKKGTLTNINTKLLGGVAVALIGAAAVIIWRRQQEQQS